MLDGDHPVINLIENNKMNDNNETSTTEYAVDAAKEHLFPYSSVAVAVNLDSGDFVSARIHFPVGVTQAEQIAILLAALQTPRPSVIYTDSESSAELYQKYVETGEGKKEMIKCINKLLLPSTKIIFVPRRKNLLADALARHCQNTDFTGYGQLSLKDTGGWKFSILHKQDAPLNEVIDLGRAIANHRQAASL